MTLPSRFEASGADLDQASSKRVPQVPQVFRV